MPSSCRRSLKIEAHAPWMLTFVSTSEAGSGTSLEFGEHRPERIGSRRDAGDRRSPAWRPDGLNDAFRLDELTVVPAA